MASSRESGGVGSVQWLEGVSWERVRQSWKATLHTVISCASASKDRDVQMAAGRCLFTVLLPGALKETNTTAVSETLEQVGRVFEECRAHLMDLLTSSKLPEAVCVLDVLTQHVSSLLQARGSQRLPTYLTMELQVVHTLLSLCREVHHHQQQQQQGGGGGAFTHLADLLGTIFKSTYSLLKLALDDIITISAKGSVLTQLAAVADVSLTFDPTLPVLCWKTLGKMLCRSKTHLLSCDFTIQPIISQLCDTIKAKCKECVECFPSAVNKTQTANSEFQKLLKLCRFLTTLLLKLVQEFEEVSYEFCDPLVHLLLSVHTTVRGGRAPSTLLEENILLLREPLMHTLISSEPFIKTLLTPPDRAQFLAWLECLCTLLKLLPGASEGVRDLALGPVSSREEDASGCRLLDAVFLCLATCYAELALPIRVGGVMYSGQPQRQVTLYEYVTTYLCAMVRGIPANHCHKIELCLLKQLLCSDPHCSLVAMDVWTLMARMGGEGLTEGYIRLFSQLVPTLRDTAVAALTSRLLSLLSSEGQRRFLSEHPPAADHLSLWARLNINSLHKDILPQVCENLADTALSALKRELKKATPSPSLLEAILQCLCSVYSQEVSHSLPHGELGTTAMSLLTFDPTVVCHAVRLLSWLVPFLPPRDTERVFERLSAIATRSSTPGVAIALCTFLHQNSTGHFPSEVQAGIVKSVICCYQNLLSHSHWLVHHTALESFRTFAEVTPYPNVVEQCIPPSMGEVVVKFLHKEPYCSHLLNEKAVRSYLHQLREGDPQDTVQQGDPSNTLQGHSEWSDGLTELRESWEKVKACSSTQQPSRSQLDLLQSLCSDMNTFLEQHS